MKACIGLAYDDLAHDNCNMYILGKILEKGAGQRNERYRVEVVRLKDRSADKVFEKLRREISLGKTLGRHAMYFPCF